MWQILCFALLILCRFANESEAQIYKWVDKNGVIHFGHSLPQDVGKAEKMAETTPASNSNTEFDQAQEKTEKSQNGARTPQAKGEPPLVMNQQVTAEMYATSWCGYCRKARAYFQARGILLIEYDIEADPEAAARKRQIDSRPGVPLVVINGQAIHGYAPARYDQALAR